MVAGSGSSTSYFPPASAFTKHVACLVDTSSFVQISDRYQSSPVLEILEIEISVVALYRSMDGWIYIVDSTAVVASCWTAYYRMYHVDMVGLAS